MNASFQVFKIIGLVFKIIVLEKKIFNHTNLCGHGGHNKHVTCTIYTDFCSPFFKWAVLEKKVFENNGHICVCSPGAGPGNPWSQKKGLNINFLSIRSFIVDFPLRTSGLKSVYVFLRFKKTRVRFFDAVIDINYLTTL